MEGSLTERLSRLIDGDLDEHEIEELESRLESDPELRRELEGLTRVRAALRSFAESEEPPAALDALVDPLLRGRPGGSGMRPWVRWLASAAVVVLGFTVILEYQRRQPAQTAMNWQEKARARASETNEVFPLAPLPTSTVPEEERPVGAADRLVAGPDPEIEPSMDAAPPLEVLGPLESAVDPADGAGRRADEALQATGRTEKSSAVGTISSGEGSATTPPDRSSAKGTAPAPPGTDARPRSGWSAAEARVSEGQLFVFMDATTAWRGFVPRAPCEAGRYAVRVRVQDGVIREVWPVANPPAPTRQVRASQLVLGLEIEDVPDGEYSAEVVVEPRKPERQ